MKYSLVLIIALFNGIQLMSQDYTQNLERFFISVKNDDLAAASQIVEKLAGIDQDNLKKHLDDENKAKAFWINAYNTYAQYLLKKDPGLYDDRDDFFSSELITIAGKELSLDDIEHGIIRRSKNKYSMGYLGKIFVGDFEKKFRLSETDYRIHFALNCGAKSCPPVALYEADRIDEQLAEATSRYLQDKTKLNEEENEVYVPKYCSWFKADFGGEDGIIGMLHK